MPCVFTLDNSILFFPPLSAGRFAVKRRESFLMALDALGKWSLIDAYVLVLMMVAFHFHITQPGKDQPQVRPSWGPAQILMMRHIGV